ncbi:MAG: transglycosylase SLT domain-containing protein [Betaproteobacteria bacterium]|nr:transglycosylase SLT domain-containing protein [Betaproteobacteria bacterium]
MLKKKYFILLVFLYGLTLCGSVAAESIKSTFDLTEYSAIYDNPRAMYSLAVKYEHAEGMPRDHGKAIALYCKAAGLGDADAQFALGWMYANGRGVSVDNDVAAQLFEMAAVQGHAYAEKMTRYLAIPSDTALPDCLSSFANFRDEENETKYAGNPIFELVKQLAPQFDVDPALVMAVIAVESAFNIQAVSSKNAQGLMQLIPETAKRFQVKDAFDAEDNIRGGMAYLRWLLAFFKGDVTLAVAAYNAGEGAVERHQGIPPYPETRDYVRKIQAHYKKLTHPYQSDIVHRHALIALSDEINH